MFAGFIHLSQIQQQSCISRSREELQRLVHCTICCKCGDAARGRQAGYIHTLRPLLGTHFINPVDTHLHRSHRGNITGLLIPAPFWHLLLEEFVINEAVPKVQSSDLGENVTASPLRFSLAQSLWGCTWALCGRIIPQFDYDMANPSREKAAYRLHVAGFPIWLLYHAVN